MQRDLSPRQICGNEFLSHFNTDIHYIPGGSNSTVNAPSHIPHPTPSTPIELPQLESNCLSSNQAGPDGKSSNDPPSPALDSTPDDIIDAELYTMVATKVDRLVTDAIKAAYKNDKLFAPIIANPE